MHSDKIFISIDTMDKKKRIRILSLIAIIIIIIILLLTLIRCSTNKPEEEGKAEETTIEETISSDNTIQENKQDEVIIESTTPIEEAKEEMEDITQMSFWVVFYDQYGNELQREALKYGAVPEYKSWLPEGFDKWIYKKSGKDVGKLKAITGNTYYQAVCHEVYHETISENIPDDSPSLPETNDEPSNPSQSIPVKGNIIRLNDGKDYRVLDVNGTKVKVLGMQDASSSQVYWNNSGPPTVDFGGGHAYMKYEGSDLDVYLDTTWYGSLPTPMKNAIQQTTVIQGGYDLDSTTDLSDFSGNIAYKYQDGFGSSDYYDCLFYGNVTVGSRHVYAIDLSEIADYLGNTITSTDLNQMFFNQSTATVSSTPVFLSSACCTWNSNISHAVYGNYGCIEYAYCDTPSAVRATFIIDLAAAGVTYTIQ